MKTIGSLFRPVAAQPRRPRECGGLWRITGVRGTFKSLDEVREKLFDLGFELALTTLTQRIRRGDNRFGKRVVERIGDVVRGANGRIKAIHREDRSHV